MIGTAGYMSPEQARGQAVDKRTDIWAFGCVLYEMLTGRVAFKGDTVSDTIVAILGSEPDWDALPDATPASVRAAAAALPGEGSEAPLAGYRRRTHRARRRRSARRVVARQPTRDPSYRAASVWSSGRGRRVRAAGRGVAAVLFGGDPAVPVTSPSEYTQLTNFTDSATAPSLSPDGRMVTFMRGDDVFLSSGQIYVKLLPNGESVQLTTAAGRSVRTGVYTGRIADRVYACDCRCLGYLDRSGARRPADAAPAQRLRTHVDRRSTGAVFRDQDRPPHGDRDRDGKPGGLARDLYSAERARDGALLLRVAGPSVGSRRRDDRHARVSLNRAGWYRSMEALPGRQVGPQGTCTSAAWSPDGQWMYFGATVGGSSHLWRQKFPDGAPEQITFGPLEEEGIALAPDGRSLVTSVGTRRSAIWIHDAAGERAISSEGYAAAPRLSRDGTRVFYLLVRDWWLSARGWVASSAELRSVDLASGKSDSVLPGVSVTDYDISRDEKEVAFTTTDSAWSIADLAGAPRPAHTTSPDRSSRRSGVLRR